MRLASVAYLGIGNLLILSLANFGGNAYALQSIWGNVIGYNESTVTVADKQSQETNTACRFDDIKAKSLLVRDQSGNVITQTTTGSAAWYCRSE